MTTLQYQKSASGYPVLFWEKHVHIITTTVTVGALKDIAQKASSTRTFGGQGASQSSVMCMTLGQSEALLAWILKNKAAQLAKITKSAMTDIGGIPVYGAIVTQNNKLKKTFARGGGTLTLGLTKTTNTIVSIVHFGAHDWDGSFAMADTESIDASATS